MSLLFTHQYEMHIPISRPDAFMSLDEDDTMNAASDNTMILNIQYTPSKEAETKTVNCQCGEKVIETPQEATLASFSIRDTTSQPIIHSTTVHYILSC